MLVLTLLMVAMLAPSVRPFWWILTQVSAWSLILHFVYFSLACTVEGKRRVVSLEIHRDRLFSLCAALALGVLVSFFTIVVPLTPRFVEVGACTRHSECVSVQEFAVICASHTVPLLCMMVEIVTSRHVYAYRNIYVDVAMVVSFVAVYFVWSVICAAINEDWPYQVQSKLSKHGGLTVLVDVAILVVFVLCYFVSRRIHHRLWSEKLDDDMEDGTVQLITDSGHLPSLQEYEIHIPMEEANDEVHLNPPKQQQQQQQLEYNTL
jgi:FAR-17a/AIG1-like protein